MMKSLFKLILYGTIFLVVLVAVVAVLTHIALVIGVFVGSVVCPVFYKFVEKRFNVEFPEFVKFQITELAGVLDVGKDEFDAKTEEIQKKKAEADTVVQELQMDVQSIKHEFELFKSRGSRKLFGKGKSESVRMTKAMEQVLGNPRWIKRLGELDERNYFEKLKV
ncbi:MAG: hypothetical protein DRN17_07865 [Thermoplasmata archaeon]|nr:MAG: hypothetical protein DRN17_07865 [Thermoplasmata archaeon]